MNERLEHELADELYVEDELDRWEDRARMIREAREAEEERCALMSSNQITRKPRRVTGVR
jgi:hypothetical protein